MVKLGAKLVAPASPKPRADRSRRDIRFGTGCRSKDVPYGSACPSLREADGRWASEKPALLRGENVRKQAEFQTSNAPGVVPPPDHT